MERLSSTKTGTGATSDTDDDTDSSSPAFPRHAKLADSTEIRDFDSKEDNLLLIAMQDGGSGGGGGGGTKRGPRKRTYSNSSGTKVFRSHGSITVDDDGGNTAYPGLVQLYVLQERGGGDTPEEREWCEVSRWAKYEQDLEVGSGRLGKPHVAPIAHVFLSKLHLMVNSSCCGFLDVTDQDWTAGANQMAKFCLQKGLIDAAGCTTLTEDLLSGCVSLVHSRHGSIQLQRDRAPSLIEDMIMPLERRHSIHRRFVHEDGKPQDEELGERQGPKKEDIKIELYGAEKRKTLAKLLRGSSTETSFDGIIRTRSPSICYSPVNKGESITLVLVREGCVNKNGFLLLVKLGVISSHSSMIALLLAPSGLLEEYEEIGRCLGTLMSNQTFSIALQSAKDVHSITNAFSVYLEESIILPPLIPPIPNLKDLLPIHVLEEKYEQVQLFKRPSTPNDDPELKPIQEESQSDRDKSSHASKENGLSFSAAFSDEKIPGPFVHTKKAFGGLINDIKRRYPLYKSDITDALNTQAAAASIFLYFASIAHNVTFGGLLEEKTNGLIGVPETLMGAAISGIIFCLFSGQPLNVIAPTGPLLVFDELLYNFMQRHGFEFLPARVWIGMWVVVIGLVVIALEGSIFVKHFSRFTMETFSALISVIFAYESMESLIHIYKEHPLTDAASTVANNVTHDGIDTSHGEGPTGEPNTALLSTFLMFGTFIIAYKLKHMQNGRLFPKPIRKFFSNFGVPLAITFTVSIDYFIRDVYTTKIKVPAGLEPTTPEMRGWLINPFGHHQPFDPWLPIVAVVPGALVFLLMFMTVEICEKIMLGRPLRKGCGLHLDPMILAFTNLLCGFFGLPWVSVATLKALAHIDALTVYSKDQAPGVPPTVVKIRENRITGLVMSILIGLSIFMAPILKYVPMPVLFGVFLYMAVTSFLPTQLAERLTLLLIPEESHPQTVYVRRVPTWKIHMFTFIQIGTLAALWLVKSVKEIALFFPVILILLVPLRRSLKYLYTESELDALDGSGDKADSDGH